MASSELLKQIQAGKRLKKAETNDRSAPLIDSKPSGAGTGAGPRPPASAPAIPAGGGPPQLGSLFAGGIPRLKPAGQGNLAKAPTLGKPPAVPGRAVPASAPSAPPPPARVTPPKPSIPTPVSTPPTRAAPALPTRAPTIPARAPPPPARGTPSPPPAALTPRRPAPPPRIASPSASSQAPPPPARPPPTFAVRASPVDVPTPPTRVAPLPPARAINGVPTLPARKAPPPPPARPASVGGSIPSRAPPPPPARKVPATDGPSSALPLHMRALSETQSPVAPSPSRPQSSRTNVLTPPVPPPSSSQRPRVISTPSSSEAPPRPSIAFPDRQVNGARRPAPSRRIPSPPPEAGSHRFPTSDFPPPRQFTPETRLYGGGRQRGSDFNLSNL